MKKPVLRFVFVASVVAMLWFMLSGAGVLLGTAVDATFNGAFEERYTDLASDANVTFRCSTPLAWGDEGSISTGHDFTNDDPTATCFSTSNSATSGKNQLSTNSATTLGSVNTWGRVKYAMSFAAPFAFPLVDKETNDNALSSSDKMICWRWYEEVSDDWSNAGNTSIGGTTGRCLPDADGLTAGSWEYVATNQARYPADLTANNKWCGAPGGDVIFDWSAGSHDGNTVTSCSAFSGGYTTITFETSGLTDQTYTEVDLNCANCPRNKVALFDLPNGMQYTERADGTCGGDAAPGSDTDYNNFWFNLASPFSSTHNSNADFSWCNGEPCRIEICIDSEGLLAGTNTSVRNRVTRLDTDTHSNVIQSAEVNVGANPFNDDGDQGAQSNHSPSSPELATHGASGTKWMGMYMEVVRDVEDRTWWIGCSKEVEPDCTEW